MFADFINSWFHTVCQMSVVASVTILVVLVARQCMKALPKIFTYMLWAVVLFRLLCPVSFSGSYSLFGFFAEQQEDRNQDQEEAVYLIEADTVVLPTEVITETVKEEGFKEGTKEYAPAEIKRMLSVKEDVLPLLWFLGMCTVLGFGICQYASLRKKLAKAVRLEDGTYTCDPIQASFVLGFCSPKIYLPSALQGEKRQYILLHEKTHIRRRDGMLRMMAYLALALHWFNPLVWVAFYVSETDMELSCDEAVMKRAEKDIRKEYAAVLLEMAAGKEYPYTGILAFGKNPVKKRVQSIASYKKKSVVYTAAGTLVVLALILVLAANPKKPEKLETKKDKSIQTEEALEQEAAVGTDRNRDAFVKQQLEKWASAFCSRDGETILAMSSSKVRETYQEELLLEGGGEAVSFGWSSPWPWNEKTDYVVYMQDSNSAEISDHDSTNGEQTTKVTEENRVEILYYAKTSDPHVTVWAEEIEFETGEEGKEEEFKIISSKFVFLDSIDTLEEYLQAYGRGINNTPVDYEFTSMGKELHVNAWNQKDREEYEALFSPETAAVSLLNLASDDMVYSYDIIEETTAVVTLKFPSAGGEKGSILLNVKMIQPYGNEGIWVPKDGDDDIPIVSMFSYHYYEFYKGELGEDFLDQYYEKTASIADSLNEKIIEVYTGNIGDGESGYVFLKDKNQKLIFYEFAHQARAGWNMIFYSPKGYFMNVCMEDRDTDGVYRYVVYRIVKEGVLQILDENVFSFDGRDKEREAELVSFMNGLFRYMNGTELLLSTQEGELRALGLTEKENLSFESVFRECDWYWWKEVMEEDAEE